MGRRTATKSQSDLERVMKELDKAGISVRPGVKKPVQGIYSGLVGSRKEKLVIKF